MAATRTSSERMRRTLIERQDEIDYQLKFASVEKQWAPRVDLEFFSSVRAKKAYTFARHQHLDHELVLVERGRYRCTLNDAELELGPRDMLLVKPGDWHEDRLAPAVEYKTVSFTLSGGDFGALFTRGTPASEQRLRDEQGEIRKVLSALGDEWQREDAESALVEHALATELFWRLVRLVPRSTLEPSLLRGLSDDPFLRQLRQVFAAHSGQRLTVPKIAAKLGLSSSAVTGKCRQSLGQSPAKAFMAWKLGRARELLEGTNMSVKEISASLGFQNQFHFSRAFKKAYGRPPTHLRES